MTTPAIAAMMTKVLDWLMDVQDDLQQHVPATSGLPLETVMHMEALRVMLDEVIDASNSLGELYDDWRGERKQMDEEKSIFSQFLYALDDSIVQAERLSNDLSLKLPKLEDSATVTALRDHARRFLGQELCFSATK